MKPRHPITCIDRRPTANALARRDFATAIAVITTGALLLILALVLATSPRP